MHVSVLMFQPSKLAHTSSTYLYNLLTKAAWDFVTGIAGWLLSSLLLLCCDVLMKQHVPINALLHLFMPINPIERKKKLPRTDTRNYFHPVDHHLHWQSCLRSPSLIFSMICSYAHQTLLSFTPGMSWLSTAQYCQEWVYDMEPGNTSMMAYKNRLATKHVFAHMIWQ